MHISINHYIFKWILNYTMVSKKVYISLGLILAFIFAVTYFYNPSFHFLDEQQKTAVKIGKDFLIEKGKHPGKYLQIELDMIEPNFWLTTELQYSRPELSEIRECWVIRYTKGQGYIEVWLDSNDLIVVGGDETK